MVCVEIPLLRKRIKFNIDFYFVKKKTIYFLEMEIGTFSCNRITTISCHTWNGVYVAGIGFGCCFVGPCPPTQCLEQMYVHRVTFSTVKISRPHARIQRWHFSKFRFCLGNGIQKTPFTIWICTIAIEIPLIISQTQVSECSTNNASLYYIFQWPIMQNRVKNRTLSERKKEIPRCYKTVPTEHAIDSETWFWEIIRGIYFSAYQ
jgi:hypothetical protein